jgi:hypothetical protein
MLYSRFTGYCIGRSAVPQGRAMRLQVSRRRAGLVLALALLAALLSCTPRQPMPIAATQGAVARFSATREVAGGDTEERLISRRVSSPPVVDGRIESVWDTGEPLRVPLTWGPGGTERALDVVLRALHTDRAVFFLAQWPGERPSGGQDVVANKLTLHWLIPETVARRLDCHVVCHTAFADGAGQFVYANAETIPQGGSGALPASGGWDAGTWTLEWSRPLTSGNPYDLQFTDLERSYSFLVKVFEEYEDRPDPTSERHLLVFQP